jgi:succinate dehydrogenase / fumarate reductase cytochrome b subunit
MSTVINPKGARKVPAEVGPTGWATVYLTSTVGQKVVVAVTGLLLTSFLLGHMVGNLKMFGPPDAINAYAHFLKHELGALLWVARGGLVGLFVAHVVLASSLKAKSVAARPTPYQYMKAAQATLASRTMIYTGLVVGAFLLFHLAHFTFGWVKPAYVLDPQSGHVTAIDYLKLTDADGRHDVHSMVVAGFRTTWVSVIYIAAQALLFVHLSHGLQSTAQTLGLKGTRFAPFWVWAGYGLAGLVLAGNLSIVFAVWGGMIGGPYPLVK